MSSWSYDPTTRTAGEQPEALMPRALVEEAVDRLVQVQPRLSPRIIVDVLQALSGLGRSEVSFTVDLVLTDERRELCQQTVNAVPQS